MLGSGPIAVATSLALHLGMGAAFAPWSSEPAHSAVDIEWTSMPQTQPEPQPNRLSAPQPRPHVVAAAPSPARRASPRAELPGPTRSPTPAPPSFSLPAQTRTMATAARFVLPATESAPAAAPPAPPQSASAGTEPVGEAQVDVPARLLASAPLIYPARARSAEVEASVALELVIDTRGRVVAQRLLEHAGYGLDEAALVAVRSYRFSPAQRFGRAVPVRMRWTVLFRLT